jgi:CRISPR-associated protein Cas2
MFVVICYDIPDDKRRNRVGKLLEGYGERVQKSVFECDLKPDFLTLLKKRLTKIVKEEDTLRYYYLCTQCLTKVEVVNGPPVTQAQLYFTV